MLPTTPGTPEGCWVTPADLQSVTDNFMSQITAMQAAINQLTAAVTTAVQLSDISPLIMAGLVIPASGNAWLHYDPGTQTWIVTDLGESMAAGVKAIYEYHNVTRLNLTNGTTTNLWNNATLFRSTGTSFGSVQDTGGGNYKFVFSTTGWYGVSVNFWGRRSTSTNFASTGRTSLFVSQYNFVLPTNTSMGDDEFSLAQQNYFTQYYSAANSFALDLENQTGNTIDAWAWCTIVKFI